MKGQCCKIDMNKDFKKKEEEEEEECAYSKMVTGEITFDLL